MGFCDFVDIPGFEGLYKINKEGDVYSEYTKRLVKQTVNKDGKKAVGLSKNKKQYHMGVDVLIRKAFPIDLTGFREIPDTDGKYLINEMGEVYSVGNCMILNPTKVNEKSSVVSIAFSDGSRSSINCRTLAARVFKDKLPEMKPIRGTDDMYEATKDGRIYSHYTESFLNGGLGGSGYLQVVILLNGEQKNRMIHRLVAETWIPNPLGLPQIDHLNMDKTDNRVENLEWVTGLENVQRAFNVIMSKRNGVVLGE